MTSRPQITGADVPTHPFPLRLKGPVTKGFGRGSKDLGIPTANLPQEISDSVSNDFETGIYYGYASVGTGKVYEMVMSYGWNPYYKNVHRSAEVHIIHEFTSDFYGEELKIIILGYIRPELNYTTKEALIEDIKTDIRVAKNSLDRPAYKSYIQDDFFKQ